MKKILMSLYLVFSLALLGYSVLPNYNFPKPPPDSVRSNEPADMENPLRRAYFTNFSRNEVLDWYESQFKTSGFLNIPLPTYLLNYPPEESQSVIRDQTRSTFLEEVVHPFRETLFVNGFEPAPDDDKNKIVINGTHWRQKITIKFVPTNFVLRLFVTILLLICIPLLGMSYLTESRNLVKHLKKENQSNG
jgi:hypothetical protein